MPKHTAPNPEELLKSIDIPDLTTTMRQTMMMQAIEGTYKNGEIQLTETPQGIAEGRVIVTFLEVNPTVPSEHMMYFGMFAGDKQSTEEAFKVAEFLNDLLDAALD